MKTVLLLGGPAAGQRVEVHGTMASVAIDSSNGLNTLYKLVPMCSHGEVQWFGVLEGADPLALLIAGYGGEDQSAALREARSTIEVLEAARPHWAQGYTSDGQAAQASSGALSALWKLLGAKHQTEAVQNLERLLGGYPSDSVHTEPMEPRAYSKVPR